MYNGHKRTHAIKWQAVNAAIGLIVHLYGPIGKYNSTLMLKPSHDKKTNNMEADHSIILLSQGTLL